MAVPPRNVERRLSEGSTDSLKSLNYELREHLLKLRTQLEQQRGTIKQAHWQRVLNIRAVRQQEQRKAAIMVASLRAKLQKEKIQELDHQDEVLQQKHDQDLAKLRRVHYAEVVKLRLEVESKENLLRRFITENRRESLKKGSESGVTNLMHRLSELNCRKRELEESLSNAGESERHFAYELRRKVEQFHAELWKVRNNSSSEVRKLIEQLKSKDKTISHLEKELGRISGYALSVGEETSTRTDGRGPDTGVAETPPGMKMEADASDKLSSSPNRLRDGYETNANVTNIEIMSPADGDQKRMLESSLDLEAEVRGLHTQISSLQLEKDQLLKELSACEEKNQELIERNKRFLEKNKELTSLERSLKDQSQMLTEDNKQLKEQCEHSKRKISQLTRQLYNAKGECSNLASQLEEFAEIRQTLMEQENTIAALRKSCSEKDRRIELIQHRKKRRRLLKSQEKCTGVKETFYGYDEDDRSVDSENSQSSTVSYGTTSECDLWDELSLEEINKNYQQLMKEHHELEKSYTLLQRHHSSGLDPQRELQKQNQLESDLFEAQCRIAELENSVHSEQQMEAQEMLFMTNELLLQKNHTYETKCHKLQNELTKCRSTIEDLEFRLVELEACQQMENLECDEEKTSTNDDEERPVTRGEEEGMVDRSSHSDMSELRQELVKLLEGQGLEADVILQKLDTVLRAEQQIKSLEYTAAELQRKVSSLQEEKAALEEMLLTPRHDAPHATSNERERAEVLTLKSQIEILEQSQLKLMAENSTLQNELQKCESQNNWLKKQMEDLKISMKFVSGDSNMLRDLSKFDKKSQTEVKTTEKSVFVNSTTSKVHNNEIVSLEHKLQMLHEENLKLKYRLEDKGLGGDGSDQSRIEELEEYCEDLQERMSNAEMSERQLREKLKLAEHTINDLENSEGHFREALDNLTSREQETKKQTNELHRTVRELKEIVNDKDFVEQALRDKVEFLEKAEAESAKIISELQASERSLRQQVELQSDLEGDVYLVRQLRDELHHVESENRELHMHVAELTENEEILRDNWRRVADEDANRRQCLEEKVKVLQLTNHNLKASLEDVKENFAFTRIPHLTSLASELSASKSCDNINQSYYSEQDVRDLEAKVRSVEEKKDAKIEQLEEKIENLQEKIGNLRENEIKLSETLAEMETTEQELRIKVSLYESKQVTVERMLQYEDQIKELHTSQENLLEKLDSLEDHEETLQEKLEMMEKIHRAKINALEKKIKNLVEEREKAKLKIEEVEKEIARLQQKCLDYTINIEQLEKDLVEAKSREEKATKEISKLERELRQKEADARIQIELLRKEIENNKINAKTKVSKLETSLSALTEKDASSEAQILKLGKEIKELNQEKITLSTKVSDLKTHQKEITEKLHESQTQEQNLLTKVYEMEKYEQELMEKLSKSEQNKTILLTSISDLEKNAEELQHNLNSSESSLSNKVSSLMKELTDSTRKNDSLTNELMKNQAQLKEYLLTIQKLENKEKELREMVNVLEEGKNKNTVHLENKIKIFEQEAFNKTARISELEQQEENKKDQITELTQKCQRLQELEREKISLEAVVADLEAQKYQQQNKIDFLEMNLVDVEETNKNAAERMKSLEKILLEYEETVAENNTLIDNLRTENKEFTERCSELESTLENRDTVRDLLKGHICDLKKDVNIKSDRVEKLEKELKEKTSKISNLESEVSNLSVQCENVHTLNTSVKVEKQSLQEQGLNLQKKFDQCNQEVHKLTAEKSELLKNVFHFKHLTETLEKEKSDVNNQIVSLQNEKKILEQNVFELEKRLELLDAERLELVNKDKMVHENLTLQDREKENLSQKVSKLESQKNELEMKMKQLLMDLESSESENKELKDAVNELKRSQIDLEAKVKDMTEEHQELQQVVTNINNNCSVMEKKNELLQDAEQHWMDRVSELEEIEQELKKECDQLNTRLDSTATLGQRETTVVHCDTKDSSTDTSDLKDSSSGVSGGGQRVSTMFTRVQDLEMENRQLLAKLSELEVISGQSKQLREKIHLLEQSEDKLMERIMQLEESEERLKSELERMRRNSGTVGDLEGEVSQLMKSESDWKSKWNSVVEDKCALEESMHKMEQELEAHKNDNYRLMMLQKELKHKVDEHLNEKERLEKVVHELRSELEAEKLNVKNLEKSTSGLDSVVKEKALLSERVENLTAKLFSARKQYEVIMSKSEQQQRDYDIQISRLHERLSESQHTIVNLQKSRTKMEDHEKKLKEEINLLVRREGELKSEIQVLETELTEVCDKIKNLEDENSSLKNQHDDLVHKQQQSEEQIKNLNLELEQLKVKPLSKTVLPKISSAFLTPASGPLSRESVSKPHQLGAIKAVSSLRSRSASVGVAQSDEKVFQEKVRLESVVKQQEQELKDLSQRFEVLQKKEKEYQEKITHLENHNSKLQEKLDASVAEISKLKSSASLSQPDYRSSDDTPCALPIKTHQTDKGFVSVTHLNIVNTQVHPTCQTSKPSAQTSPVLPTRCNDLGKGQKQDSSLEKRIQELEIKLNSETKRTVQLENDLQQVVKIKNSLTQQITEYEHSEHLLKNKVCDLQQKLDELNDKLASAEKSPSSGKCDGNHIIFLTRIEQLEAKVKSNSTASHQNSEDVDDSQKPLRLKIKTFEEKSSQQTTVQKKSAMLDKPEDILQQQIRELERLEKHHKQQINDLEADRERLHEIARKDKSLIHEQNVRIRELQLGEKVLREQVTSLEQSERALFCKCEQLEAQISKMEDRIHELNIHERRLRDLVRKLKLDEELWLAKSENMELTVEELSASEANLKARLQELAEEKFGLAEKANYLDARIKELEMSETALFQRVKNYEHFEASLQSQFSQLENAKVAAQSKVSELDMMNMDMSQRYQRVVEENAIFLKHVQEQQGLVQDLSRQLMVVRDSELCLKQQVDSLEKNETALQKRVKEYQLREIDFQARLDELRQSELILKDRVNTLQRNNNTMKYKIQELEDNDFQNDQSTYQKESMPVKLEDCQKRIEDLQMQVESLQNRGQLRLGVSEDADIIKVPRTEFERMETKVALLADAELQMSAIQRVNAHLKETVTQLRQGKDVCGHEVELEAFEIRLRSYEELVLRLKQNLSQEQVTSLWDSESQDQGPSMEILPKRNLQFLESERVMQTVRGLTGRQPSSGESPPRNESCGASSASSVEEEAIEPIQGKSLFHKPKAESETDDELQISVAQIVKKLESGDVETAAENTVEEEHWKTIESVNTKNVEMTPVSSGWKSVAKATTCGSPSRSSKQEELVIGLTLPSESELSHSRSQNDSDSSASSPRSKRVRRVTAGQHPSTETIAPPLPKTRPPSLSKMKVFAQGTSYYLPSYGQDASVEEESLVTEGVNRQNTATSLDTSSVQTSRTAFSLDSVPDSGRGTASTSRGNIRDRIAQIERQLQGKESSAESRIDDNDSVFTWSKTSEKSRQLEASETEVKQLKDEQHPPAYHRRRKINKLEKELEEKRRHIDIFENWTFNIEKMLKNKDKRSDRNIVQVMQTETVKLRSELRTSHYRREELLQDPAAVRTELDNRDRELAAKKILVDALTQELHQWKQECQSIEDMRANALDSLRSLEMEIMDLQDTERQLQQMNIAYNKLRKQLEKLTIMFKTYQKESAKQQQWIRELSSENERLSLEVVHLGCQVEQKELLGVEMDELNADITQLKSDKDDLGLEISHLKLVVEQKEVKEMEYERLNDEIEQMKTLLQNRMDRVESLKEENKKLQENLEDLKRENDDLKNIKHEYEDLKSRFESVQNDLKKASQATKKQEKHIADEGNSNVDKDQSDSGTLQEKVRNTPNSVQMASKNLPDKNLKQEIDQLEIRVEHLEAERLVTGQDASEGDKSSPYGIPDTENGNMEGEISEMQTEETGHTSPSISADQVASVRSYKQFLAESGLAKPEPYPAPRPQPEHVEQDLRSSFKCTNKHATENVSEKLGRSEGECSKPVQVMRSVHCQTIDNSRGQSKEESTKECKDSENSTELPAEMKILLSRCRELEKLKSDIQAELKVTQSKLNKILNLESENEHLKDKLSSLHSEVQKMENLKVKTASLEKECGKKDMEIRTLHEQIKSLESLEMENIELKHQVEGKVLELQFLTSGDLSGMKSRLKKLASVERENRVLNEQLEEKITELEKLKKMYYNVLNKMDFDSSHMNKIEFASTTVSEQIHGNNPCTYVENKMMDKNKIAVDCPRCRNINYSNSTMSRLNDIEEENKLLKFQLNWQIKEEQVQEAQSVKGQGKQMESSCHTINQAAPNTSNVSTSCTANVTATKMSNMVAASTSNTNATNSATLLDVDSSNQTGKDSVSLKPLPNSSDTETEEAVKGTSTDLANSSAESEGTPAVCDKSDPRVLLMTLRSKLEQLQEVETKNLTVQRKLEESAKLLKQRYDDLEKQEKDSPNIAALKSQVAQLVQKCKEKDELIQQLMKELEALRQGETTPSSVTDRVTPPNTADLKDYRELTPYSTPISIVISPADRSRETPPQNTHPISTSTPLRGSNMGVHHTSTTQTASQSSTSSSTQTSTSRQQRLSPRSATPQPPKNFRISRLIGNTGIMLSWQPVKLIEDENSNNPFVIGYRLFLDGKICQQVCNPRTSKTVMEDVNVNEPHHFAIQTVAMNDQLSSRVELIYEGVVEVPSGGDSDGGSSHDTSVMSSMNFDENYKRLFMGVYDYRPDKQADHYSKYELAFRAGDIIAVYGGQRPDGYYHGEIDGRRGLVPSGFIEEVPPSRKFSPNSLSPSPSPRPPRSHGPHSPHSPHSPRTPDNRRRTSRT